MIVDHKAAAKMLIGAQDVLILCHQNPDGDTLGSAFAVYFALASMGIRSRVLCPDAIPAKFSFLQKGYHPEMFTPQFILSVDVADLQLLKAVEDEVKHSVDLCIDHHESNSGYARHTLLEPTASATAQIVFDLLSLMQIELDLQIATCIYTGISTDTGCFKYSNTSLFTHLIAAKCMQVGVDFAGINRAMFETKSKNRIAIERMVMDTLDFYFADRCAIVHVTRDMFDRSGALDEEIDSVSDLPRQIEGVDVGVSMRELVSGGFKVSMRSCKDINVSKVCAALGGGGHQRAAGCFVDADLKTAKMMIVSVLKAHFEQLDEVQRRGVSL